MGFNPESVLRMPCRTKLTEKDAFKALDGVKGQVRS
jgi:hypothetical protein